jgi:hypothetical protein
MVENARDGRGPGNHEHGDILCTIACCSKHLCGVLHVQAPLIKESHGSTYVIPRVCPNGTGGNAHNTKYFQADSCHRINFPTVQSINQCLQASSIVLEM